MYCRVMERGGAGSALDSLVSHPGIAVAREYGIVPTYLRTAAVMGAVFAVSLYCALFLAPPERAQGEDTAVEVGAVAFARQSRAARSRAEAEEGSRSDQERTQRRRTQARALGMMLRKARLRKGVSQEQLALAAGITVYTYGGLERGHTPRGGEVNPTFDTVMRILHALDIDVELKPRYADRL